MTKKWYRSRKNHILILLLMIAICTVYYVSLNNSLTEQDIDLSKSSRPSLLTDNTVKNTANNGTASRTEQNDSSATPLDITNRDSIIQYIESRLQKALKEDKGTGCQIPYLDPFAKEAMKFNRDIPPLICDGTDWVKCYLHECRVTKKILETMKDIKCTYHDIIYISDAKYVIGAPENVFGGDPYKLVKSDFVKIMCTGKFENESSSNGLPMLRTKWRGYGAGYRAESSRVPTGDGAGPLDVLIFGYDSTSKNGFIRKMPKSYKYITEELSATVLNGYNIVGDGTPAALFPILTGKTELELPEVRKTMNKNTLDGMPFIFYKLKKRGFHTAYFEDMPNVGTFQYRFNGFKHQPADHYLRAFYLEQGTGRWKTGKWNSYCVGDTPRYKLMMNLTEQFFKLPGRHFAFTFIADITHDEFNMISLADDASVDFLRRLKDEGHLENTLLFIMGDHGARFGKVRDTMQGKLEERLPLMAIRIPRVLTDKRPGILANLVENAEALTTPHDIHTTILDALDMRDHMNHYKIRGADLERGISLFEPIPRNRSCSEAGIEPHWCACHTWQQVSADEPIYGQAADAFLAFLNSLTEKVRSLCAPRTLSSVSWVMVQRANSHLVSFGGAKDNDGYIGNFQSKTTRATDNYQIKMAVGPGIGVYEASATYIIQEKKFIFDARDVSRVNAYNDEPSCISSTLPHLNKYCYCKDHRNAT